MAYTVIPSGDIVAGKPTKEEIFDQIRTNQEDFDTRLTSLSGTSQVDVFNIKFAGKIDQYSGAELASVVPIFKAPTAGTLVSFVMTLLSASTSGTLSAKLEKSTDNGQNWSAITTSDVQLTGTTIGSISGSVTWPDATYSQNDLIRLVFTGIQVDQGEFHVSIYGEL